MPKVTILVPIYNSEKYLRQCLNSVVNQTLTDIEIICINDGSTDDSLAIMKEFQKNDNRIRIIDKENTGYGHSMNIGIMNSNGKYIGIVESDDFAELDMFQILYDISEQHQTDVAKGNYFKYSNNVDSVVNICPSVKYNEIFHPYQCLNVFYMQCNIWSAIYRKDFLANNGILFLETDGASYQDTSFNFKVWACAEKVYITDKPLIHYRLDNENQSVKSQDKVYCICDEYKEIESFLNNNIDKRKVLTGLKNYIKFSSYFWNINRLSDEKSYNFKGLMIYEFIRELNDGNIDKQYFSDKEWDILMKITNQERR